MWSEYSVPFKLLGYAVPYNLLKSIELVSFQALDMVPLQRMLFINQQRASCQFDCIQPL